MPTDINSLHYIDVNKENQYQTCLRAVSSILIQWDTDKIVPVYGFGAKFNGNISHCFEMFDNDGVYGVDGIMDSYNATIRNP